MNTLAFVIWGLALVIYAALFWQIWQEYCWDYGTRRWRQAWGCCAVVTLYLAVRYALLLWMPTLADTPWFQAIDVWKPLVKAALLYAFVCLLSTVFHVEFPVGTEDPATITIDSNSLIVEWSPQTALLFGWTADEVVGKKTLMQTIMPPQEWEGHRYGMARFLAAPIPQHRLPRTFRVTAYTKARLKVRIEIQVTSILAGGETWHFQGVIRKLRLL